MVLYKDEIESEWQVSWTDEDNEKGGGNSRWYDKRPLTAKAMDLLEQLPRSMQEIVAKGVYELTENEFDTSTKMKSVRSLGKDKVLGLYMAKRRLRYLDELPSLHTAIVHLYVLNEDAQDFMAEKIIEMMEYVRSYLKSCKEYEEEAQNSDVMGITNMYVEKGGEDVENFLQKLQSVMIQKVQRRRKGARVHTNPESAQLKASDKGMKIRGFDDFEPEPMKPAEKPDTPPSDTPSEGS